MSKEVMTLLQAWFDEERGNRVTSNNMQTLVLKLTEQLAKEQRNVEDNGTPGGDSWTDNRSMGD